MNLKKYLLNCFLLLIPLFVWNIILIDYLPKTYSPAIFWKNIPNWIAYTENIFRIIVFIFPAIMIFSFKTRIQKIGFLIYLVGLIIYFLSWIIMIVNPESIWGQSLIGFMAPAYTTILFFVGIGLIGNKSYFRIPHLSLIYIILSTIFVVIHTLHTYIVYQGF